MTSKEYLKQQYGDQYENKEYHWTGLESAWIAGYEEAMGIDPRTINVDPYAPWREKKKRGEKFEYRCPNLCEDWVGGEKCLFLNGVEYEFRDFIPHREWKEKYDKGVKLQYRRTWSKPGEWFELNYWGDWCKLKDSEFRDFIPHREWKERFDKGVKLEYRKEFYTPGQWYKFSYWRDIDEEFIFREAPVKEPVHYQCSECGVSITENYKHDYPVTGGVRFKCDKCFYKKDPIPLGPEDFIGKCIWIRRKKEPDVCWMVDGFNERIASVLLGARAIFYVHTLMQEWERLVNNEWIPCAK